MISATGMTNTSVPRRLFFSGWMGGFAVA